MAKIEEPQQIRGITHCHLGCPGDIPRRDFTYSPPKESGREVVYQDDLIVVFDKPAGLLSVPGKAADHYDCVEYRVQKVLPDARIVHRLDMATSGLMVLALNAQAHRHLGLQFERRHVAKQYLAEVWGRVVIGRGMVSLPMRCDWPNRPIQMVDFEHGRNAETRFEVVERRANTSLVRLFPVTGRSHQLRLHLAELGHPILGDAFYAPDEAFQASSRLHLHAARLEFFHPADGRVMVFESEAGF